MKGAVGDRDDVSETVDVAVGETVRDGVGESNATHVRETLPSNPSPFGPPPAPPNE